MSVDSANNSKLLDIYGDYACRVMELDQNTNEPSVISEGGADLESRIRCQAKQAAIKSDDGWLLRVTGCMLRLQKFSKETIRQTSPAEKQPKKFETEKSLEEYSREFASLVKKITESELNSQKLNMIDTDNAGKVADARTISEKLDSTRLDL